MNFKDTKESSDLSAVQVDAGSTYLAEDTSFEGFDGEVGACWRKPCQGCNSHVFLCYLALNVWNVDIFEV